MVASCIFAAFCNKSSADNSLLSSSYSPIAPPRASSFSSSEDASVTSSATRSFNSSIATECSSVATLSKQPRNFSALNTKPCSSPVKSNDDRISSLNEVELSVSPGISAGISLNAMPTADRSLEFSGSIFEN